MTDAAAMQASYADFKLVKTRSAAQIVLELPIEEAERFLQIFGVPLPGKERHVAIALLRAPDNTSGATPNPSEREPTNLPIVDMDDFGKVPSPKSQQAKERYRQAPEWQKAAMRASILCGDEQFQNWIRHHGDRPWPLGLAQQDMVQATAYKLRGLLGITSRAEIGTDRAVYERYIALETQYLQDTGKMAEARE